MSDVYIKLRDFLNQLGTGFPQSKSGVEIKILKKLFLVEDAELFIQLPPGLRTPEKIAQSIHKNLLEIETQLEQMAQKGLLLKRTKGDKKYYSIIPYVVGIFEYQIGRMDKELADLNEKYLDEALAQTLQSFETPIFRAIPINKEIVSEWPIAPYEDAYLQIENQNTIAVAPCICRLAAEKVEKSCGKPLETCLLFGATAEQYVQNKWARFITSLEALEILKKSEEVGLVLQPFNSQKVNAICSCCGCCCGVLKSLKKQPHPAESIKSNYFLVIDEDKECLECGVCVERCQMGALSLNKGLHFDMKRCISCGLCVLKCPTNKLKLVKKNVSYIPPQNEGETYQKIFLERQNKVK